MSQLQEIIQKSVSEEFKKHTSMVLERISQQRKSVSGPDLTTSQSTQIKDQPSLAELSLHSQDCELAINRIIQRLPLLNSEGLTLIENMVIALSNIH